MLMIVFMLGTFLLNSLPSFLLFDSDASRSIVSHPFSRGFDMTLGELKCLLQLSIVNEHEVSALIIFQDCTLEIFGVFYPIDLIPILMRDVWLIVGMDWLSKFGAMIDCERQWVVV